MLLIALFSLFNMFALAASNVYVMHFNRNSKGASYGVSRKNKNTSSSTSCIASLAQQVIARTQLDKLRSTTYGLQMACNAQACNQSNGPPRT